MEKTFLINNKKNMRAYENILKIATGQGDDYTTGCLQDHNYFKDPHEIKTIDFKQTRKT